MFPPNDEKVAEETVIFLLRPVKTNILKTDTPGASNITQQITQEFNSQNSADTELTLLNDAKSRGMGAPFHGLHWVL